jgi:pimeloyl-ACP methyl ester carboxylesterase
MFHRPGLGESDMGDETRNTERVVYELVDLLDQLEITEKVILVGHSYGGLCVQHFVRIFPDKVAGIILVDSTSVTLEELDVLDEEGSDDYWLEAYRAYSLMERSELKKIINPTLTRNQLNFPLEIQQRILDFQINPLMYKAMYLVVKNWKLDVQIVKTLNLFPNIPLMVIVRDKEYCIHLGVLEGLPEEEFI